MSRYNDGSYIAENPTWHEEDAAWKATQFAKILDKNGIAPKTFCEVGCGAGGILVELVKRFPDGTRLFGYEISPQAFAICKGKETANLSFVLGDLLTEDVGPFDVVIAADVFEHVEDCFGFLRKLRSKGAAFIFHIPLDLSAQTVLRGAPLIAARKRLGHLHYFTRDTALALLEDTGYEVLDSFFTGSAVELPNLSMKRRLASIPRRMLFAMNQALAARALGGYSLLVLAR